MTNNSFQRLAPFIQEYIYRKQWKALRNIQEQTIKAVFDTPNHILITSGTASGKTEAAFLPIVTELYNQPPASIGVIYIGPLKALINDQFERLRELLAEANIPVQSWHGDIEQGRKAKFLKNAKGILQITPEALEAMLMNRHSDLQRLFGELRYIVIDEVHAFIDNDRGLQVLCQLGRLQQFQKEPARRIGLSATLGDPQVAMQWLAANTKREVTLVQDADSSRELGLGLEYFPELGARFEDKKAKAKKTNNVDELAQLGQVEADNQGLYEHMYNLTLGKKTLIFTNSRRDAERVTAKLREIAQQRHTPDIYYIHHGSVAPALRQAAEQAMQTPNQPACTAATLTLELGIDIGYLDQVLQLNATHSVASFVQRLGRTGRRGGPSQMFFYSTEIRMTESAPVVMRLPWSLLQTVAIIQLYIDEQWIEPPDLPDLPYSLLYHQTMSAIVSRTEMQPVDLANQILTLWPFKEISPDDYRQLLRHMLDIKHLERAENGSLIIGTAADRLVNNYQFYATFNDETLFTVHDGNREIGTLQAAPNPGTWVALAGYTWKVVSIDSVHKIVHVERASGPASTVWLGGSLSLHDRIVERMRQVLEEDAEYVYAHPHALNRLSEARQLAKAHGLQQRRVIRSGTGRRFMLLLWCGTRIANTIRLLLRQYKVTFHLDRLPFYAEISVPAETSLKSIVDQILKNPPTAPLLASIVAQSDLQRGKFDRYIPEDMLRKAYAADNLDVAGAIVLLQQIVPSIPPEIPPKAASMAGQLAADMIQPGAGKILRELSTSNQADDIVSALQGDQAAAIDQDSSLLSAGDLSDLA